MEQHDSTTKVLSAACDYRADVRKMTGGNTCHENVPAK
jgi:hypothetical protein